MSSNSENYVQKTLCFNACNRDTEAVNKQMSATSSSKNEPNLKRKAETESNTVKNRKWNDDYIKYEFFLPQSETSSDRPSARCLFCSVAYGNQSLVPSKLRNQLENKHAIHRNDSEQFFKKQYDYFCKQKTAVQRLVIHNSANKNALLESSFQIHSARTYATKEAIDRSRVSHQTMLKDRSKFVAWWTKCLGKSATNTIVQ